MDKQSQSNKQQQEMSSNELISRKSRYSDKQYQNSSLYNHSVRSELNNLSIDLPKKQNKYSKLQKQIIEKQGKGRIPIINLANTKYPILQQVCGPEDLNWKTQCFGQTKNWNIKWCDTGVTNEMLQKMNYLQRINHFPNMNIISRKNNLAATLCKMKDSFPRDYDYFPRTFLYPNDFSKIRYYYVESRKKGLVKTFIVKPEAGCQGRGIYLTQNPADFQKEQRCVIQKYIANPLLFKGLKFDLRIYVLLASCYPLRIYLYNQGLVRFATQKYELPQARNLQNFYIHLTNYAINKSNPNYQYNYSVNDMTYGHKKSLAQFFKTLKEMGYKANSFWGQIKDQIIKTLIAAQPMLAANYKTSRPQQSVYNMCFELLGFDFMIDNQDRCYLLQVNHTPSFSTDTPLDHIIKKNLIRDTLQMMSPSQEEINLKQHLERLRQREKYVKFKHGNQNNSAQKQRLANLINEAKQKHEMQFIGTYQLIYPTKHQPKMQKYTQFLAHAAKMSRNTVSSTAAIPSVNEFRNRLKEVPKNRPSPRQIIKENINKNMSSNQTSSKKNIIYNYNYLKKEAPSKKALLTLPSQPYRLESHPKSQLSNGNSRALSSQRFKIQKTTITDKMVKQQYPKQSRYPTVPASEQKFVKKQLAKHNSSAKRGVSSEPRGNTRELNHFQNRIRSYKTPLMF